MNRTEVALLFSSLNRPREDKAWNYLRPPPHVAPYILMKPIDGPVCECVVLDGHRGKVMTNSNDPPNSFHTKDLFIAHATIPNAWKFVGRLDDRVTLTNGEKVLPLPMEGRIQQDPLVKEAVVFGVDRPVPGLLLFRAKSAEGLSDEEFLRRVWPAIEDTNSQAEGFSQISQDMVIVIPEEIDCPSTDKSSIKRAQVYKEFASSINNIYTKLENSAEGTLKLSTEELEVWIISSFQSIGIALENGKTDFFAGGVDSLKAIQMRGLIIKNIDLAGNIQKCSSMIVYDCGNAETLAKALYAIRTGEVVKDSNEMELGLMSSLIKKYSRFEKHTPSKAEASRSHVVVSRSQNSIRRRRDINIEIQILTGATGSLGSHLLAQIVAQSCVSKVFCLVRTSKGQSASTRLEEALAQRKLSIVSPKVIALSADLSHPNLGIDTETLELLKETTHIIHCAWAVNFALPLQSLEPQLAGLHNLTALSLSVKASSPAKVFFCSSVGTAMGALRSDGLTTIPEAPIEDLSYATKTGYSRSKLVAEHIIENAVREVGAHATILRIGQIIPSTSSGSQLWNPSEMIPLMVQSAMIINALPESLSNRESCSWLDVDTLAKTILELSGLDMIDQPPNNQLVYNLVHPRPFSWSQSFLPALKAAGLQFESVPYEEWLKRLTRSEQDTKKNPSRKLLGFWEESNSGDEKKGGLKFDTQITESHSKALRGASAAVDGKIVKALVDAWRAVW
jgi:thioester reductase-like protein